MFLLTEGTLFFLDLALSARIRDQKPSLSSVVQTWVDGVAAATDASGNGANTTNTRASSTLYAPPPVYPSVTVGQLSPTDSSHGVSSKPMPKNAFVFSNTSEFPEDHPRQVFAPSHADDEHGRETVTSHHGQASLGTSRMVTSSAGGSDNDRYSPYLNATLSQRQQEAPRAVKRKVDDTDIVSDIEPDANGDDDMDIDEPIPEDASQVAKMVGSTATKPGRTHTPPTKRVKREDASLSAQPEPTRRRVYNEGYTIEVMKKRSEYTNRDLPVSCDQRWSHSFISTAILWYSVQKDIWNVPKEDLTSALQRIFNVVYPDVKYRVTPTGSVFALTLQRINEWQNSFGSSALAMMLHFFSALDNNDDIRAAAELLATDFRFLREDPDSTELSEPFRSAFLHVLMAITHLGDIAAFVDVPGWDTWAMAAGKGGEGVIAIASAALERALRFFCDGTLDVDQVLAEIARCGDLLTGMGPEALPKTVLDTLAGHDAPAALRFSSTNWSGHTTAYRESVRKRGTTFVRETFTAAQARRRRIAANADSELCADASVSGVLGPRALF